MATANWLKKIREIAKHTALDIFVKTFARRQKLAQTYRIKNGHSLLSYNTLLYNTVVHLVQHPVVQHPLLYNTPCCTTPPVAQHPLLYNTLLYLMESITMCWEYTKTLINIRQAQLFVYEAICFGLSNGRHQAF